MIFTPTEIEGVVIIDVTESRDERGAFARVFDETAFRENGLVQRFAQHSIAQNTHAGTIRGLHYQIGANAEVKLIRCTAGALFDVAVDLRRDSKTFGKWTGVLLDASGRRSLYIPAGCAHGYQTMADQTEAMYLISSPYEPAASRGIHYADSDLGITWARSITVVSARDDALPNLPHAELP